MFRKIRATFFLAIAAFLVLLPAAWAQSTSAIQGTVLDSSGAVVANAQVTVQNQGTSELRTTQTDSNGRYAVPSLPVGTYKITVKTRECRPPSPTTFSSRWPARLCRISGSKSPA
ncbi:MAG: hypothetical protein DMG67_10005 [Acidobacteria bacterium]|nr:MAG: hypothetical protein DMG67_10005 [Acidobacteriota bacterium]